MSVLAVSVAMTIFLFQEEKAVRFPSLIIEKQLSPLVRLLKSVKFAIARWSHRGSRFNIAHRFFWLRLDKMPTSRFVNGNWKSSIASLPHCLTRKQIRDNNLEWIRHVLKSFSLFSFRLNILCSHPAISLGFAAWVNVSKMWSCRGSLDPILKPLCKFVWFNFQF